MNTKFTPGPWVNNEQGFLIGKNGSPVKVSGLGSLQSFNNRDEHKANAELMKCAPDMYAEIKRDIECLTRWIDNHGDAFPMTAAWKDMRANKIELLKRARGEL